MLTSTHSEHPTSLSKIDLQLKVDLLQSKLDQAQRMATLGELLSTTTHEFNNVLMSVINYTRMAMRQKDEEARLRYLQKVLDASDRAARISKSILGAARNRSNQLEPTDLTTIIEDTVVLMEKEFGKYGVHLSQQIESVPTSWHLETNFNRSC